MCGLVRHREVYEKERRRVTIQKQNKTKRKGESTFVDERRIIQTVRGGVINSGSGTLGPGVNGVSDYCRKKSGITVRPVHLMFRVK